MDAEERYRLWLEKARDPVIRAQLTEIAGNAEEIRERFYGDLKFGTAGLRGILGAGSARMNIYTVGRATQGFARFIADTCDDPCVAVSFDSRHMSREFSRLAARIFAANGVKTYLFEELQPTPVLSFTVRDLHLSGGVMITASHNPSAYNGYKAYGSDGCQLSVEESDKVTEYIEKTDTFEGVRIADLGEAVSKSMIVYLGEPQVRRFLDACRQYSVDPDVCRGSGLKVVYTPLNGTGKIPVCEMFAGLGVEYFPVSSQFEPDGDFPTCPYPNPEMREALEEGLKVLRETGADLLIATDPDADRIGAAVPDGKGGFRLISGNEMGCLFLDYLLSRKSALGTLPPHPVAVKSIVTTTMADAIGERYGAQVRNSFTGFKYICGELNELESEGRETDYIMGFEESYGYCLGRHVRDKDAVSAAMILCQMAAWLKKQGSGILRRLGELYEEYGYYASRQKSFVFPGVEGMGTMARIMESLRAHPPVAAAGENTVSVTDYLARTRKDLTSGEISPTGMESSNVLEYRFGDGAKAVVRPSGTEPKLKLYILLKRAGEKEALEAAERYERDFEKLILK